MHGSDNFLPDTGLSSEQTYDDRGSGKSQTTPEDTAIKPDLISQFSHCSGEVIPGLVGTGANAVQLRTELIKLNLLVLSHGRLVRGGKITLPGGSAQGHPIPETGQSAS